MMHAKMRALFHLSALFPVHFTFSKDPAIRDCSLDHKIMVNTPLGYQRVMGPSLDNLSPVQNQDLIRIADGFQLADNHRHSFLPCQHLHGLLQHPL